MTGDGVTVGAGVEVTVGVGDGDAPSRRSVLDGLGVGDVVGAAGGVLVCGVGVVGTDR
jgi:hypothetical protein